MMSALELHVYNFTDGSAISAKRHWPGYSNHPSPSRCVNRYPGQPDRSQVKHFSHALSLSTNRKIPQQPLFFCPLVLLHDTTNHCGSNPPERLGWGWGRAYPPLHTDVRSEKHHVFSLLSVRNHHRRAQNLVCRCHYSRYQQLPYKNRAGRETWPCLCRWLEQPAGWTQAEDSRMRPRVHWTSFLAPVALRGYFSPRDQLFFKYLHMTLQIAGMAKDIFYSKNTFNIVPPGGLHFPFGANSIVHHHIQRICFDFTDIESLTYNGDTCRASVKALDASRVCVI